MIAREGDFFNKVTNIKLKEGSIMKEKGKAKEIEQMIEELQEYYQSTGFSGQYEENLQGKTPLEIMDLYKEAFEDDPGEYFEEP